MAGTKVCRYQREKDSDRYTKKESLMKRTFGTWVPGICLTLLLIASCALPGSDQAKIKSATKAYATLQLKKGERYEWNCLERKRGIRMEEHGYCKEALVHYRVIGGGGEEQPRTLYLLMSEHCDSVYAVRELPPHTNP